ncbi:hypothetical protein, partial [Methylacidimicrobium cyclopophantes]|uniref:hypothetical protein n=1 Tax=Methylacidimicrobium cyclopophantes TaxID=1041766 RepID=UPI00115C34A7
MRASKPPRVIRSDRSGYSRMVIYWGEDGKRHREYFHSPAEARRRAKELRSLLEQAGREAIAAVTPERLTLLRLAEDLQARLAPYALSLEEVGKRLLLFLPVLSRYGVSLEEAFRRTSELLALERNSPPVRMVVERLLDAKAKEGKSPRTLRDLRSYLGQFCCSFGDRPIACIRRQEIAEYLDKAPSLWVRYNWQRTLSTLFAFAKTRQWLWENPLHGLPVARPKLPEIRSYSPREAQTLLVVAREKFPEVLPYLALGFFAGLRRAELQRLDWQDIKGKYVRVSAGKAKTASTHLLSFNI